MADIIISSRDYRQQLIDLYYGDIRELVVREGELDGFFFFTIERRNLDVYGIAELFEDIILSGNEALVCSPKLYETVRGIVFRPMRERTARELENYFRCNREMCVDGYLNFRLAGAVREVNRVLYALIKKYFYFTNPRIGEIYDY